MKITTVLVLQAPPRYDILPLKALDSYFQAFRNPLSFDYSQFEADSHIIFNDTLENELK